MRIRLACTVALALAWLAASPAPGAAAPRAGGTLVYATGTDALALDPQFVTDVPTARAVMHIHETLFDDPRRRRIRCCVAPNARLAFCGSSKNTTYSAG